ncbi:MAG: phage ORF5 protein [Faecalibacillus sp.]
MEIFAIKDEKVGFLNVLSDSSVDIAKFNFGRGFYCENPEFGRLEDYSLYKIGEIDVSNGFHFEPSPVFVCNGLTAYNAFVARLNALHIDRLEKGCDECANSNISKENK